jgi:hypothetical protein
MRLTKLRLPEVANALMSINIVDDLEKTIEKQTQLASILTDSSSGRRGDELFELAKLYYQKEAFAVARECVIQAIALRRVFYGKNAKEFFEAVGLAKLIFKELAKTQSPPRRRRRQSSARL